MAIRLPRGYSVVVESSVRQATRGAIILGHNGQTNGINYFIQFVCPLSVSNTDPMCGFRDGGWTDERNNFSQFVCPSRIPIRAGRARARCVVSGMEDGQTNGINFIQFVCPSRTPIRAGQFGERRKVGERAAGGGCRDYLVDIDAMPLFEK